MTPKAEWNAHRAQGTIGTMLDPAELSKIRFHMTAVPEVGGQPGIYEERWAQWFLEQSFFREFVYRNPVRRKGYELADAVVLFDDVALLVHVKTQCGSHEPKAWATEALLKAQKQMSETHAALNDGSKRKLENDVYGSIVFDQTQYPNQFGIVVLAQLPAEPYSAKELVPKLLGSPLPIHVFSLNDFQLLTSRFDTAMDFITFLEMRTDGGTRIPFLVHDEEGNLQRLLPLVKNIVAEHTFGMTDASPDSIYDSFRAKATGELHNDPDWKYGLSIDDMIARSHDVDPNLPWSTATAADAALEIAEHLGRLTRDRRIKLGKRVVHLCEDARDGEAHYFPYRKPSSGKGIVFLSTSAPREDRTIFLHFLVSYAVLKYGLQEWLGVATEPIGGGRSYDFVMMKSPLPKEVEEQTRKLDNPFRDESELLFQLEAT
jgi:hypothetical protein